MGNQILPDQVTAGVIGLGLMGSSIVVSLLVSGHEVKAIAPMPDDLLGAPERIRMHLAHCEHSGLLTKPVDGYLDQLLISDDYADLKDCDVVLECVIELKEVKASVYRRIEDIVNPHAVIATNTSAIPISELQVFLEHPGRFMGIHWAEPSYLTRFLEITCGNQTSAHHAERIFNLAHHWGKEPTLLRKDIRGFVTNRLMYSVYREGLSLYEKGVASLEDIDKAFRYDAGSWITLMGIFRRMDYLGLQDYPEIFRNIFPTLSNDTQVPAIMQGMIDRRLRGTQTNGGLYNYTPEDARKLEAAYASFNEEIYKLALQYPSESRPTPAAADRNPVDTVEVNL